MLLEDRQKLNFLTFRQAHIRSMDWRAAEFVKIPQPQRLFSAASLLEGLGWLYIGVAISYFDRQDVVRYEEGIYGYPRWLLEIEEWWAHAFDQGWLRVWFSQTETRKIPLDLSSTDSKAATKVYEGCLTLWYQLNSSLAARYATSELTFSGARFRRHTENRVRIEDIGIALDYDWAGNSVEYDRPSQTSTFFAGYGQMIEFLEGFLELRNRFRSTHTDFAEGFCRTIAQLLKWRFFFFERQPDDFRNVFVAYCNALGLEEGQRAEFQSYVLSLCNGWSGMQFKAASAGTA